MIRTMNRCGDFIKYVKNDVENAMKRSAFQFSLYVYVKRSFQDSRINYASDLLTFIKLSAKRAPRPYTMNIYK